MKIENWKIAAEWWAGISAQGPTLLAWSEDNTARVVRVASAARCAQRAITARAARAVVRLAGG
jgi:hypothetical protein